MKSRARLVSTLAIGTVLVGGVGYTVAQTPGPSPFRTPTAAVPTPGRNIQNGGGGAGAGGKDPDRARGAGGRLGGPDPVGGARPPRDGRHEPAAGRAGGH